MLVIFYLTAGISLKGDGTPGEIHSKFFLVCDYLDVIGILNFFVFGECYFKGSDIYFAMVIVFKNIYEFCK